MENFFPSLYNLLKLLPWCFNKCKVTTSLVNLETRENSWNICVFFEVCEIGVTIENLNFGEYINPE